MKTNTRNSAEATEETGAEESPNFSTRGRHMKESSTWISPHLFIWLGTVLLAGALAMIIGRERIMEVLRNDSSGITPGIVIFFIVLFAINAWNMLMLSKEKAAAQRLYMNGDALMDTQGDSWGRGVAADHFGKLVEAWRNLSSGEIRQEDMARTLRRRLMGRDGFVRTGCHLLITLGLIGTMVGLTSAMTGLEGILTSMEGGSGGMMDSIRDTLGGMGTAFNTTLAAAVLGGLLLKLLVHINDGLASETADIISDTAAIYILPHLRKTSETNLETASGNIRYVTEQFAAVLEGLGASVEGLKAAAEKIYSTAPVLDDYMAKVDRLRENVEEAARQAEDSRAPATASARGGLSSLFAKSSPRQFRPQRQSLQDQQRKSPEHRTILVAAAVAALILGAGAASWIYLPSLSNVATAKPTAVPAEKPKKQKVIELETTPAPQHSSEAPRQKQVPVEPTVQARSEDATGQVGPEEL